jgi:hypothetical protein
MPFLDFLALLFIGSLGQVGLWLPKDKFNVSGLELFVDKNRFFYVDYIFSSALFRNILRQEIGWFDVNNAGELSNRLIIDLGEKINLNICLFDFECL